MGKVLVLLLCALVASGCAASRSNAWTTEDAQFLANDLASAILAGDWLKEHIAQNSSRPALLLGTLESQNAETFPQQNIVADLTRELLLSGKVRLILPRINAYSAADSLFVPDGGLPIQDSGADFSVQMALQGSADATFLNINVNLQVRDIRSNTLVSETNIKRQKPLLIPRDSPS